MNCEQILQSILEAINDMKISNNSSNDAVIAKLEKISENIGG